MQDQATQDHERSMSPHEVSLTVPPGWLTLGNPQWSDHGEGSTSSLHVGTTCASRQDHSSDYGSGMHLNLPPFQGNNLQVHQPYSHWRATSHEAPTSSYTFHPSVTPSESSDSHGNTQSAANQEQRRLDTLAKVQDLQKRYADTEVRRKQRKEWHEMYPDKLPPIRLLSQAELYQLKIQARRNRYHVAQYLEEKKLCEEGVGWCGVHLPEPTVDKLFVRLVTNPEHLEDTMIAKKQMQLDKLFDEAGWLEKEGSSSSKNKKERKTARLELDPGGNKLTVRGPPHDNM